MWLLVAFIAASLATGQCQSLLEVDVAESKAFQSSISGTTISDCYITLPSGSTYELLPNDTLITSVDERFTVSGSTTVCRVSIDSTSFSDSGSYSLVITGADNVAYTESFILRVQERAPVWPSTVIDLIASESVYTFLNSSAGTVQACYVTPPGGENVEVKYGAEVSTDVKQWSPSTESWCGIEITNVASSGYWKLTAAVNSTHFYYNRVLVNPEDSSIADDTWTVITPAIGQSLTDSIGHENASYCQLTNPQGEITQVVAGRCSFNITMVTSQHNGSWIAHTGLKGSPTEVTETVDVIVQDIPYIYTGSSENQGVSGAIDIYCRVYGVESEICRFVSPDGTGVSMILGVGNDEYAPYYDSEGVFSCGLTILDVSSDHYGTWTCYTGNSTDVRIGYITLEESVAAAVATRADTVAISISSSYTAYSVYNSTLTLACSALTSLNYCWFGHPNGSYFTAHPDATDNGLWSYSGDGLTSGSCSITFTYSSYDDAGTWTCNMGITGQATDVSVDITVQITSSSLTARSVVESEGTASVECAVLDDTKALSYCRFIRPDGVGINAAYADSDSKYSMTGDLAQGTCGLAVSSVQDVDLGTWVCAGRLQSSTSELSDTFKLSSAPKFELSLLLLGVSIIKALIS